MSEEVKRYDSQYEGWNEPNENGDWMLYEDHERIVESLRLSHEQTTKQLRALEDAVVSFGLPILIDDVDQDDPSVILIQRHIQNSRARKQG